MKGSVMGPLPERKGSELPLKAGEAVIAQECDCNGRQDPEKYLRYIGPCQASQHDQPRAPPLPINTVTIAPSGQTGMKSTKDFKRSTVGDGILEPSYRLAANPKHRLITTLGRGYIRSIHVLSPILRVRIGVNSSRIDHHYYQLMDILSVRNETWRHL